LKIAVTAEGPDLEAKAGHRFGTSPYLLVIDLESNDHETIPIPGIRGGKGSGMQAVALAIRKDVRVVLTGYCSPVAEKYFTDSNIKVVAGIHGVVGHVVDDFKRGAYQSLLTDNDATKAGSAAIGRNRWVPALKHSAHQFIGLLPILSGVILLTGLLNAFISKDIISSIFTGDTALDAIFGAFAGSIFTGNPINSYVIGGELLENGVSLFAVTAFIVSWVTVGLVQLPAEIASLGKRFALVRNGIAFIISIVIAMVTPIFLNYTLTLHKFF